MEKLLKNCEIQPAVVLIPNLQDNFPKETKKRIQPIQIQPTNTEHSSLKEEIHQNIEETGSGLSMDSTIN